MAAAFRYMEDSSRERKPDELRLLDYIDRFGVQAVMGRPTLGAGEIKGMIIADNVRQAYLSRDLYRDRDGNKNWAEWAREYPQLSEIINEAMRAAEDSEHGE